jgi:hypothetical protein
MSSSQTQIQTEPVEIWSREYCVDQAIVYMKNIPDILTYDAEYIQDYFKMPFRKQIVREAQEKMRSMKTFDTLPAKCTYDDCINQVKLMLQNQNKFISTIQDDLEIPFRKKIIRSGIYIMRNNQWLQEEKLRVERYEQEALARKIKKEADDMAKQEKEKRDQRKNAQHSKFVDKNPFSLLGDSDN